MLRALGALTCALAVVVAQAAPPPSGPPGGDTCATAPAITALPFTGSGTTVGAVSDVDDIALGCSLYTQVFGPDVAYKLELGTGNSLSISATPANGYDVAVYLLAGCGDGGTCELGADDLPVGGVESFTVSSLAPGSYSLYVDSYYSSGSPDDPSRHQGAYTLTVSGTLGTPVVSTTTVPTTTVPGATTTTTTTLPVPLCSGGVPLRDALVRITHVGDVAGAQGMRVRGVLALPAGAPFDPAASGVQLAVEDVGSGGRALLDASARTAPIPPGGPGAGCGPRDGWRRRTYRNRSNALDPPACPAGSASGLTRLHFVDRRAKGQGIAFAAVVAGTSIGSLQGPLRVTLVLGADPAAGAGGTCGTMAFSPTACAMTGRHGTFVCR